MEPLERAARSVASAVPQLLGVQVETADPVSAQTVAVAIERLAENFLRWHDRLVLGVSSSAAPAAPDPGPVESPVGRPASVPLRTRVHRGELPGSPVSLQLGAAELRSVVCRIRADAGVPTTFIDPEGERVVDECLNLAAALDRYGQLLRLEGERLAVAVTPDQRGQVLAGVVRAEQGLIRAATATVTP